MLEKKHIGKSTKASGVENKNMNFMSAQHKYLLFIAFHLATKILKLGIKSPWKNPKDLYILVMQILQFAPLKTR